MKILMFSDIHCDASTAGQSRFDEVDAFMAEVVKRCEAGDIDVAMFLGDAYDPGTLDDPRWAAAVLRWAVSIDKVCKKGSVWIAGNHDVVDATDRGGAVTTLSALRALTELFEEGSELMLHVSELPEFYVFGNCGVLTLPYVSAAVQRLDIYKSGVHAAFERAQGYRESFPEHALVVAGHLSFDAMHPGSETEMPRGRDVMFPVQRVKALNPSFVANGHYHKREVITRLGQAIQIVGAPLRFTFGEKDDGPRGYLVAEV